MSKAIEKAASQQDPAPEDSLECQVLSSQQVWSGVFLRVDAAQVQLPDGQVVTHDVVRHPGACGIVVLDGQGNMLIERQYRTALERVTREIPAGKLDPGEDPVVCAARELEEETGYRAGTLRYLMPVAVALGYSDEIVHLFLATDLQAGDQAPDPDEFLSAEWVPVDQLYEEAMAGRIEDSKTLIGIFVAHDLA